MDNINIQEHSDTHKNMTAFAGTHNNERFHPQDKSPGNFRSSMRSPSFWSASQSLRIDKASEIENLKKEINSQYGLGISEEELKKIQIGVQGNVTKKVILSNMVSYRILK